MIIPTGGFKRDKQGSHGKDHASEMKFKTPREYENAGIDFMSRPLDEWTEELLTSDGKRVRYNHQKNWYGVVGKSGDLKTFYSPDDSADYWKDTVERDGRK